MVQCRTDKGFDINSIKFCSFRVGPKEKTVGNFCFYRKVDRKSVQGNAPSGRNNLRMLNRLKPIAHQTDNNALNKHSKQGCVLLKKYLVAHKKKDCHSVFQLRLFCTVFGVIEESMQ